MKRAIVIGIIKALSYLVVPAVLVVCAYELAIVRVRAFAKKEAK